MRPPGNQRIVIQLRAMVVAVLMANSAATFAADEFPDAKADAAAPTSLVFHVAKVVTMNDADAVINNATLVVTDGKVVAIGARGEIAEPDGARVVEMPDHWLVPGLVDAHNHTAGGLGDLNDMVYLTNPGLDTYATVDPDNDLIQDARRGGVTTVMLIPGSGTNISGFGTLSKTAGHTPEEVIIRSPGSLKIAQAGNPEWYFGGAGRQFMNWNTRTTLEKAKAYHDAWTKYEAGETKAKPEFDPIFEGYRGLFRREYPATVHTQIYQVLMTTVDMVTDKLGIWTVLDHCTFDAWKVAPLVLKTDAWVINGPRQFHFDRTASRMIGNANGWAKNGVTKLGINTDAPVVPERELSFQATMACWYGWKPYLALKGVTRVPADALGVSDRVGQIAPGHDADFGVWTGDPIDPRSACLMTVVNGKIAYDGRERTRRF